MTIYTQEQLLYRMRCDGGLAESMIRSWSGADQADSEFYRLRRLFWVALWEGKDHESARADFVARWRAYAAANNARVDAAPKIKRGPSRGHSAISHRWVDPEKAESDIVTLQARAEVRP